MIRPTPLLSYSSIVCPHPVQGSATTGTSLLLFQLMIPCTKGGLKGLFFTFSLSFRVVWLHGLAFDWYGGAMDYCTLPHIVHMGIGPSWMTGLVSLIYSLYAADGL
jgi:hypothetical protein